MVVDPAMLVIDDQQCCAVPDSRISVDGVVYAGDEFLAFLHIVIGMLVRRQNLSASGAFMVVVAGFDKTVLGKRVGCAIGNKLVISCENLWLVFQEIYDLHRRALLVVVIDFCCFACGKHSLVRTHNWSKDVENIHSNLSKRCSVMGECAIADRGARDR